MKRVAPIAVFAICAAMCHLSADRVWLRDGQVLEVEVTGLSGEHAVVTAPWLEGWALVPVDRILEWALDFTDNAAPRPNVQVVLTDGGVLSATGIRERGRVLDVVTSWGRTLHIPVDAVREVRDLPEPEFQVVGGPLDAEDWKISFEKSGGHRMPRPPLEIAGALHVSSLGGATLARRIPYHPRTRTRIRFHVPRNSHPRLDMTFFSDRSLPRGTGALHVRKTHGDGITLIPFTGTYGGFDLTTHSMDPVPPYEFEVFADRISGRVSVVANGKTIRTWTREPVDPREAPEAEWFVLRGRAAPFYIDRFDVEVWDGEAFPDSRPPSSPPEDFRNRRWLRFPATGDLLGGELLEFDGREFVLTSEIFPEGLRIPAEHVGLAHFHSPETVSRTVSAREHDFPWELDLRSGTRFPVFIEAWTPHGVVVRSNWSPKPLTVKRGHIQELLHTRFTPDGEVPAMRIRYRDGSRLAADPTAVAGQDLAVEAPWGQTLVSPSERMARMDHVGRRGGLICSLSVPDGVMGYSGDKKEEAFQAGLPFRSSNSGVYMDPVSFPKVFRICATLETTGGPLNFGLNFWGKDHSRKKPERLSIHLLDGPEPLLELETSLDVVRHPLPIRIRGIHDFDFRLDLEKGRVQVWVDGGFLFETSLPAGYQVDVDTVYLYDRNWTTFWIHDFRLYRILNWPEDPDREEAPADAPDVADGPRLHRIRNGVFEVTTPPDPRVRTIPIRGIDRVVFPQTGEEARNGEGEGAVEVMAPWSGSWLRLRTLELEGGIFKGKSPNWNEELRFPAEAVTRIRFGSDPRSDDTIGFWPWVPLFSSGIELQKGEW